MSGLLTFLLGPVGRWVMVAVAFVAWTAYQRDQAADRAREECQAEQLRRTVQEIERQRDAARDALAAAEQRARQTEVEMAELENSREQIVQELQERAGDSCAIPDAAVKRLRNIR